MVGIWNILNFLASRAAFGPPVGKLRKTTSNTKVASRLELLRRKATHASVSYTRTTHCTCWIDIENKFYCEIVRNFHISQNTDKVEFSLLPKNILVEYIRQNPTDAGEKYVQHVAYKKLKSAHVLWIKNVIYIQPNDFYYGFESWK